MKKNLLKISWTLVSFLLATTHAYAQITTVETNSDGVYSHTTTDASSVENTVTPVPANERPELANGDIQPTPTPADSFVSAVTAVALPKPNPALNKIKNSADNILAMPMLNDIDKTCCEMLKSRHKQSAFVPNEILDCNAERSLDFASRYPRHIVKEYGENAKPSVVYGTWIVRATIRYEYVLKESIGTAPIVNPETATQAYTQLEASTDYNSDTFRTGFITGKGPLDADSSCRDATLAARTKICGELIARFKVPMEHILIGKPTLWVCRLEPASPTRIQNRPFE